MEMVLPQQLVVDQLRPHPDPPVAVLLERLPRLRAAAPDGAVPLLERVGQQPRALPARSSSWPGSAGTPAGAGRSAPWCWSPPSSPSPSRSTAGCGSRSRSRPCTPPSVSPSTAVAGPCRLWSPPCSSGASSFVSSPLYDTLVLRVETPHSNDRRAGTAETVVSVTAEGSPFVGYGTTRTMQGSFSSLAGGETEQCHQCAAPPLGTQGFMWRLVLTTGFGGTVLCLSFFALQFLRRARGPAPARRDDVHGPARRGALLLRLRLARLGDVHRDDRHRADGPRRPEPSDARWSRDVRDPPTPSASYAAEVARLLWPEPWGAPYVTRSRHRPGLPHRDAYVFPSERRPRLLVPADVPGFVEHAAAARRRPLRARRPGARRSWSGRSARGPSRWPAGRCCASRATDPARGLDREPPRRAASAPRSASASCSAPAGSTRSRCCRSSTSTGRLLGYAKVGHNDLTAALVRREAASLAAVGGHQPRVLPGARGCCTTGSGPDSRSS